MTDFPLETERLLLRPWRAEDAAMQHQLWTERDSRVPPHRRIDAEGHPSVAELEERIRSAEPTPGLGLLAVLHRETGDPIGYCGLIESTRAPSDEPELAYEFLRANWGNGYATEAGWAVIDWARGVGHGRLWAGVREWNGASRRVLAKLGFGETDHVETDAAYGNSILTMREL